MGSLHAASNMQSVRLTLQSALTMKVTFHLSNSLRKQEFFSKKGLKGYSTFFWK